MAEMPSRKLAVILHADVVDSTALVHSNESVAHVRMQDAFRHLSKTIHTYGGMVHEIRGDALVAAFSRASDAVCAALAFQAENTDYNSGLRDDIRPELRVGISLGEVVVADGTMTGAGVVLAQRLEQLAESGGVVVQGTVSETVPTRLPFEFESLGEQSLKGFDQPVRVFGVRLKPGMDIPGPDTTNSDAGLRGVIANSGEERLQLELPDKPSIAVLPFTNLSSDPEQEYFSDGITEDIITNLSRFPDLVVIARHSTFSYKGKSVTMQQVGRELGVRYVLEGSVQRSRNTVRITAQLVNAMTSHHLWAERYDRELREIFSVRDEVTHAIVATLMGDSGKVIKAEIGRILRKAPENFDAYDCQLRGTEFLNRRTKEANAEAGRMFRKAIKLDPKYASSYQGLAWTHIEDLNNEWSEHPKKDVEQAYELAKKALELDDSDYANHWVLGIAYLHRRQHEQAIAAYEKAQLINPNDPDLIADMATPLTYSGRAKEGIACIQRAMDRNPLYPDWYARVLGWSYAEAGQHKEAVAMFNEVANPPKWVSYVLAASYAHLGWIGKATTEVEKILHSEPNFSLKDYAEYLKETQPYKNSEMLERFLKALRKAGFPE